MEGQVHGSHELGPLRTSLKNAAGVKVFPELLVGNLWIRMSSSCRKGLFQRSPNTAINRLPPLELDNLHPVTPFAKGSGLFLAA